MRLSLDDFTNQSVETTKKKPVNPKVAEEIAPLFSVYAPLIINLSDFIVGNLDNLKGLEQNHKVVLTEYEEMYDVGGRIDYGNESFSIPRASVRNTLVASIQQFWTKSFMEVIVQESEAWLEHSENAKVHGITTDSKNLTSLNKLRGLIEDALRAIEDIVEDGKALIHLKRAVDELEVILLPTILNPQYLRNIGVCSSRP